MYTRGLFVSAPLLNPIILPHDTNLFCSHQGIKKLFRVVNSELEKVSDWFNALKLALNERKTKYLFFHRHRDKADMPLKLPSLFVNKNYQIES